MPSGCLGREQPCSRPDCRLEEAEIAEFLVPVRAGIVGIHL
ncbi:hypothetical protein [Streptomyces sp. HUAS TT20]|nr:hypothetical protein [Streptomyces sp. HUAS 15-9]UXY25460.1 hypothetical protein N8I87_02020 [Streptomyces sp. HUAS 15-9]